MRLAPVLLLAPAPALALAAFPRLIVTLPYHQGRPPAQQQHQPPQALEQAPLTPQPPLVFGKWDDGVSDDGRNDDANGANANNGVDDEEDEYPHAFVCPITHVRASSARSSPFIS